MPTSFSNCSPFVSLSCPNASPRRTSPKIGRSFCLDSTRESNNSGGWWLRQRSISRHSFIHEPCQPSGPISGDSVLHLQNCTHREQRVDVLMPILVQLVAPSVRSTHLLHSWLTCWFRSCMSPSKGQADTGNSRCFATLDLPEQRA